MATCKHVLWTYHDVMTLYGGFGHNVDFEDVDYARYFFTTSPSIPELDELATLLRQGALTALCCEAVNLLDEAQRSPKYEATVAELLRAPDIADMPFEAEVLTGIQAAFSDPRDEGWEAHENGSKLQTILDQVNDKYVLGYYRHTLAGAEEMYRRRGTGGDHAARTG